jgi:hypothetical protein
LQEQASIDYRHCVIMILGNAAWRSILAALLIPEEKRQATQAGSQGDELDLLDQPLALIS